ncbi:hypothetical protein [Streptomyces sp. NPDC015131]|uniref:hypothetical protein n=1 Tax=Streptomyces sp. NPDC015131 TaxID=3364941 RepID=UPI0036FD2B3A
MPRPESRGAWRHPFLPGRLIMGLTGLAVAALYAGDAAGAWHAPWYALPPLLCSGLALAGVAGWIGYRARRRAARAASADSTGAPASTSGSHAIR